jgi:hypothetical protein
VPRLLVNPRSAQALEYQLKPGENHIGRNPVSDLNLNDPSVSWSHCRILVDGTEVLIQDLGSSNGTFINQIRVREAPLRPGQIVHLGSVEALFKGDPSTAPIPRPSVAHALPSSAAQTHPAAALPIPPRPPANAATLIPARPPPTAIPPPAAAAPPPPIASSGDSTTRLLRRGPLETSPPPSAAPPAPIAEANAPVATAAFAEPAPPSSKPAASKQPILDAPDDKQTCKFHPKVACQWLCPKCAQTYCSSCVTPRQMAGGAGFFCRLCGSQCREVRSNYVPPQGKEIRECSDVEVLVRSIGFGGGAALLLGGIWIGVAAWTQLEFPFVYVALAGVLCGYAVKVGAQDRPGILFCSIAVFWTIMAVVIGEVGAYCVVGKFYLDSIWTCAAFVGTCFAAWKISGADF